MAVAYDSTVSFHQFKQEKAFIQEITIKTSSHPVFCVSTTRLKIHAVTEITAKAQNVQDTMRMSFPCFSASIMVNPAGQRCQTASTDKWACIIRTIHNA